MKQKDLDECWAIIDKSFLGYEEGMNLAQRGRVEKALKLAYNKGKKQIKGDRRK